MSRPVSPPTTKSWRGVGPIFLEQLAEAKVIESSSFAFYLESYANENGHDIVSFVDIGGYVPEHMKQGLDPVWFDLEPTMYWMVNDAKGVKFVNKMSGTEQAYKWLKKGPENYPAILDSGTSLSMIPEALY